MIKLAKILQIDDVKVLLKLEEHTECSDCESRCSDGFLSFLFSNNDATLLVSLDSKTIQLSHLHDNNNFFSNNYNIGDVIGLKFDESQLFKLSVVLYGLPILLILLMLISCVNLFSWLGFNMDLGGILGLVIGLLFSRMIIRFTQSKLKPQVNFFK